MPSLTLRERILNPGAAICDPQGRVVAASSIRHLGSLGHAVRKFNTDKRYPVKGDMIVVFNDPFSGSTRVQDFYAFRMVEVPGSTQPWILVACGSGSDIGGARFVDTTPGLNGVSAPSKHSIQLDINNDGRQDLITCNPGVQAGYPSMFVSVYRNLSQTNNHWITLRLRGGGRSNGDAVGAVARITAGGRTQVRELISGSSTTATEDLRLHFGLGSATEVQHIQVLWPRRGSLSSRLQTYGGPFKVDRILTLHEATVAPGASFVNSGI